MARLKKSSGTASAIIERPISVFTGKPGQGPHYKLNVDQIHLGDAYHLPWDRIDQYAVLVHECGHVLFPASYPPEFHSLANLLDDCRQERQMGARRSRFVSLFRSLAINVIANRKYDEIDENGDLIKDPWLAENFKPSLWALLFFRTSMSAEVHDAANAALKAWVKVNIDDADKDDWKPKFDKLVRSGLAITRLKNVSEETLRQWCALYLEVFPQEASEDGDNSGTGGDSNTLDQDNPAEAGDGEASEEQENGDKGKNEQGEGDKGDDNDHADKANEAVGSVSGDEEGDEGDEGEGSAKGSSEGDDDEDGKGKGGSDDNLPEEGLNDEEAQANDELADALEKLKEKLEKEGDKAKDEAENDNPDDEEEEDDEGSLPGIEAAEIVTKKEKLPAGTVDQNFVKRFTRTLTKLRTFAQDKLKTERRAGRIAVNRVIRKQAQGLPCMKPFDKSTVRNNEIPLSVAVATDNSISTENIIGKLNDFTHNTLYALRKAKCESAGVVWNSCARTIVKLDEPVSAVTWKKFRSAGGTSVMAAANEIVNTMKGAKGTRKLAFIFTDGEVWEHEIPQAAELLKKNGFAGALLVSLVQKVPKSGILDTAVARSLDSVASTFDKWAKEEFAKAEGLK